jgi:aryl-alcohol dehydrogenase-like predicted oxidoreductase
MEETGSPRPPLPLSERYLPPSAMDQRRVPGFSKSLSPVGIALAPLLARSGSALPSPQAVGLLRRARSLGVNVFDADAGAMTESAERLLRVAFPDRDPALVLLSSVPEQIVHGSDDKLHAHVLGSRQRLGDNVPEKYWIAGRAAAQATTRHRLDREFGPGTWGVRVPSSTEVLSWIDSVLSAGPPVLKLPYSLLEREPAESVLERSISQGTSAIVSDPHARGMLDGARLSANPLEDRRPPAHLRQLQAEYAPVLRLAFLTRDGSRTLPQAALRFVLDSPGVGSALVEPPGSKELDSLLRASQLPPISVEERARLPSTTG